MAVNPGYNVLLLISGIRSLVRGGIMGGIAWLLLGLLPALVGLVLFV